MKIFTKGLISIIATTTIVSGLVYAVTTINTATTQTINTGDIIGVGWFQAVNDKIAKIGALTEGKTCKVISGKIECTFDTSAGSSTGPSNDCNIITATNRASCYDGHGFNLRDTYPYYQGGTCQLDGVTLAHSSYRYAWPTGAAIELRNISGRLWAYGKNFPADVSGNSGWWLALSGNTDRPLCDLTDTLTCTVGIFEPQYNQIEIVVGISGITTGCTVQTSQYNDGTFTYTPIYPAVYHTFDF